MTDEPRWSSSDLPKGWSHPLKRREIESYLGEDATKMISFLSMSLAKKRETDVVLCAWYTGVGAAATNSGKCYIYTWAVQSERRKLIHNLLIEQGLARLRQWLLDLSVAGEGWRMLDHRFEIKVRKNGLIFTMD